jgi:hypothetical protein
LEEYTAIEKGSQFMISDFHHEGDKNCALLGYYAWCSGNFLTFQDNLSVPSSRVKTPRRILLGPTVCPKTSVRNYYYTLHTNPEQPSSQDSQLTD